MIPNSVERVPQQTAEAVNEEIRLDTDDNVASFANASVEAIELRLRDLDKEWDIERLLEANAASLCVLGVVLGATVNRRWFLLPGVVGGFLLQHALQGWCPPLPLFRRLGFRTQSEIERERYALKALRGDFYNIPRGRGHDRAESALNAVDA